MVEAAPRILTTLGWVEGFRNGEVASFLGIPYAAPPVAARRFRKPEPFEPWEGIRPAKELGNQCVQNNPDHPAWLDASPESEDCLVLNVWAPADGTAPVPVMVWLHGGAYSYGSAGVPIYDGANLAGQGNVVVVSINHRLNVFGYTWFGDLVPELAEHANPGQRDIEMALRWVRENAATFGGDPANVTVVGESGGGGKIGALCASPGTRDLFDKMVIQSGAQTQVHDREAATEVARLLLDELDVTEPSTEVLDLISVERWRAAAEAVEKRRGMLAFQPVIDGAHLVAQPWSDDVLTATAEIPLLIGTTSDETVVFGPELGSGEPTDDQLVEQLREFFLSPSLSNKQWEMLIEFYREIVPGVDRARLAVALTTDLSFWGSTRHVLDRRPRGAAATFAYEFAWKTPCYGGSWSPHAGELPFLFGNLNYPTAWDGADDGDQRSAADPDGRRFGLKDTVIAAWSAFARKGDPSTPAVTWQPWSESSEVTMILDGGGALTAKGHGRSRWDAVRTLPRSW